MFSEGMFEKTHMHAEFARAQIVADVLSRQSADSGAERRRSGRVRITTGVQCNLGEVLDISGTGLRLLARKAMCGVADITLLAPGIGVRLPSEIMWSKRLGFRKHLLGVRFLEVDAGTADVLRQIAAMQVSARAA